MRTIAPTVVPTRGGIHGTYGVFLGGGSVELGWLTSKARYSFSTQRRDERSISKVARGLTYARDKTTTLIFNGRLELEMREGSEHELDKEKCVRIIERLTREHGHPPFYAIEHEGVIFDMLKDQHLFLVEQVISSHKFCSGTMTTDASKYDAFETGDFDMIRLVVESRLTEKTRDAICTRFDHNPDFYDYPGPVVLMMALDICNSSQSFDIEGAKAKMDNLKLEDYPGEDVTACAAFAHT
jgi:hypothetical protein